jgi:hypothetical protein
LAGLLSRDLASAQLNILDVDGNVLPKFSRWPDFLPDFISTCPRSVPEALRAFLEGQVPHFYFDEEVRLLYRIQDGQRLRYISGLMTYTAGTQGLGTWGGKGFTTRYALEHGGRICARISNLGSNVV